MPTGRVTVYCYLGATLIASTTSDPQGLYQLTGVPPGSNYIVYGESTIERTLYTDTRTGIRVTSAQDTPNINLFLMP